MRLFTRAVVFTGLVLATPAAANDLSTSVLRPTPIDPALGLVAGKMPGGAGSVSYYLAVDLKPGDLVTQLQVAGRAGSGKRVDFELLDRSAKPAASGWILSEQAKADNTKTYPIDTARRYLIRVVVEGKETGTFCVLMGGSALPSANPPACPGAAAAAPPPPPAPVVAAAPPPPPSPAPVVAAPPPPAPPAPKMVEVIVSKCEERLRVGSDFLFDFDRAEVRSGAEVALSELSARIEAAKKVVMIEGHTDGKGSDAYNRTLSERRASAVRVALEGRGLPIEWLNIRGYGKSKPVAPNQHVDGSDDPEGRARNRRVEVVINTCR